MPPPTTCRDFGATSTSALRYLVVLVLPASVLFVCLAQSMIGVLTIGGFAVHNATMTADVLQAFAISLGSACAVPLHTARLLCVPRHTHAVPHQLLRERVEHRLAIVLFPSLGVQGLALAWSAAYLISAGVAVVALRRRIGHIPGPAVGPAVAKAALGSAALAIVAIPLAAAIGRAAPGTRAAGNARCRRRRRARLRRRPRPHPVGGAALAARPRAPARRDACRRVTMRREPKSNADVPPAAEE